MFCPALRQAAEDDTSEGRIGAWALRPVAVLVPDDNVTRGATPLSRRTAPAVQIGSASCPSSQYWYFA